MNFYKMWEIIQQNPTPTGSLPTVSPAQQTKINNQNTQNAQQQRQQQIQQQRDQQKKTQEIQKIMVSLKNSLSKALGINV